MKVKEILQIYGDIVSGKLTLDNKNKSLFYSDKGVKLSKQEARFFILKIFKNNFEDLARLKRFKNSEGFIEAVKQIDSQYRSFYRKWKTKYGKNLKLKSIKALSEFNEDTKKQNGKYFLLTDFAVAIMEPFKNKPKYFNALRKYYLDE